MPLQKLEISIAVRTMMLLLCTGVLEQALCSGSMAAELPPLQTVPRVDLERYMGEWYEIASFPQRFQKGCVASKATYTMKDNGRVEILNECRDKTLDGKLRKAKGTAWVIDKGVNAKLKVRFFWPFSGDYWIIDLGSNYEYAVVGHPKRSYLWILSRTAQMDQNTYNAILDRLRAKNYDVGRIVKTLQPGQSATQ
jgi:apolipoprotein D and lipocalin family protein